ncbi:hypothetical protein [Marinobacter sp.]|uniref:hypothetical protein n=1 Tax=Marinobacter sp. TaxID=50741 RepID=UPI0034A1D357
MIRFVQKLLGTATLAAMLSFSPLNPVIADEMAIPVGSQAERNQSDLPLTGMSQDRVRKSWGSPRETSGPVGDPPISQWHYDDFVVYFESDQVLHAVLKSYR